MINVMFCTKLFKHFGCVFATFICSQDFDLLPTLVFNKHLESLKDFEYFVIFLDYIDSQISTKLIDKQNKIFVSTNGMLFKSSTYI